MGVGVGEAKVSVNFGDEGGGGDDCACLLENGAEAGGAVCKEVSQWF